MNSRSWVLRECGLDEYWCTLFGEPNKHSLNSSIQKDSLTSTVINGTTHNSLTAKIKEKDEQDTSIGFSKRKDQQTEGEDRTSTVNNASSKKVNTGNDFNHLEPSHLETLTNDEKPESEFAPAESKDEPEGEVLQTVNKKREETKPITRVTQRSSSDLSSLRTSIATCERCFKPDEHNQRFIGVGQEENPKLMVILNPASQRELNEERIVSGRSAVIFQQMLFALGLNDNEIYITHAAHCGVRHQGNADEIAQSCRGHLQSQITSVAPNVVLTLGEIAAQSALITSEPLERLRNETHILDNGVRLRASYHPFDLLERPANKSRAWQDIRSILTLIFNAE